MTREQTEMALRLATLATALRKLAADMVVGKSTYGDKPGRLVETANILDSWAADLEGR